MGYFQRNLESTTRGNILLNILFTDSKVKLTIVSLPFLISALTSHSMARFACQWPRLSWAFQWLPWLYLAEPPVVSYDLHDDHLCVLSFLDRFSRIWRLFFSTFASAFSIKRGEIFSIGTLHFRVLKLFIFFPYSFWAFCFLQLLLLSWSFLLHFQSLCSYTIVQMASASSNSKEILSPNPLSVAMPVRVEEEAMTTEDDSFPTVRGDRSS